MFLVLAFPAAILSLGRSVRILPLADTRAEARLRRGGMRPAWALMTVLLLVACEQRRADPPAAAAPAAFVGSAACAGCHDEQYRRWQGSHHERAMQPATAATVLGDFGDARLTHFGVTSRMYQRDGGYYIETDDADATLRSFRIDYTFGVYPLQQYLVAFPGGRMQALTIAWDSRPKTEGGQRWFHLQPDGPIPSSDPLHWTGPYFNWNSRCAECHSTGVRKRYDATTSRFATTWTDAGVGCEACHGPGSEHLAWAKRALPTGVARDRSRIGLAGAGLAPLGPWARTQGKATAHAPADTARAQRQLDVCGGCHSRRELLVESGNMHGLPAYDDAYVLALPTPPLYHADGQIREEDFELGSFLQSRMHANGVVCSNCHEPHSLALRESGNGVCVQCHAATVFDTPAHHHHAPRENGGACVDCHMPVSTYMEVDRRRDHSLRIPRADLSVAQGTPNACTQCHARRDARWAAAQIAAWRGEHTLPPAAHFSERLASNDPGAWRSLAGDRSMPAIARAAALARLAPLADPQAIVLASRLIADPEPLVRAAAASLFQAVDPGQRLATLWPLAGDLRKSVRMQVAPLLARIDPAVLPAERRATLVALFDEYQRTLESTGDLPGHDVSLGLFLADRGDMLRAEAAYRIALQIDRQFVPAYVNLADLYRQQAREEDARRTLQEALDIIPASAPLHHALGLQRVRQRAYAEAINHLRRAHELAPDDADFGFVYAVALHDTGSPAAAVSLLRRFAAQHPRDGRFAQALAAYGIAD